MPVPRHRDRAQLAPADRRLFLREGLTTRACLALACVALVVGCTGEPGPSAAPTSAVTPGVASPAPSSGSSGAPTTAPTVASTVAPTGASSDGFDLLPATTPAEFDGSVSCSGTIDPADPVAIVQLRADVEVAGAIELQDYADPGAPRTVCTFSDSAWYGAHFLDATHIVASPVDTPGLSVVIDLPEVRFHWFQLPAGADTAFPSQVAALSPALDRLIWVSRDVANGGFDAVHVTTAAGDQAIAKLRDTNEGRCGDPDDSNLGDFTHSGTLAYVLNRPLPADASLLVVDGEQVAYSVLAPKAGWPNGDGPAMAVWSTTSDTLYYRNGDDVWRWSADGGAKRFLSGVRWFLPTISPDGTYVAYSTLNTNGLPDVYLLDLANAGDPLRLGTGRHNLPSFLDNEHLWYDATSATGGCDAGDEDTQFIYNLVDGTESPTTILSVIATWPATSASY